MRNIRRKIDKSFTKQMIRMMNEDSDFENYLFHRINNKHGMNFFFVLSNVSPIQH